jgi:hypothetical protein
MSEFGWLLVLVGAVCGLVGLLLHRKVKKMNAVPYRRPAEIAQLGAGAADAKGLVSTEGAVAAPQPLLAPMSGQQCLAYEIVVERRWEREEQNEKGEVRTNTGSDVVMRRYEGSLFQLRDELGAVWVDATKQPDVDLERSHSNTERVGVVAPYVLGFGQMQFQVPPLPRDSRTTAFVGTERVLKPVGSFYALGQLEARPEGAVIGTPKGILSGRLLLSSKGRAKLLASSQLKTRLAFGFAAALVLVGTPMGIFGPHVETAQPAAAAAAASLTTAGSPSTGAPGAGASIAVGQTVQGALDTSDHTDETLGGVVDEYSLALTAGQPVTILTTGGAQPGGAADSHLDVVAALLCNGQEVARDDDGGGDLNSRMEYTPTATGPCTVRVWGFAASMGAYTLAVLPGGTSVAAAAEEPAPLAAPSRGRSRAARQRAARR